MSEYCDDNKSKKRIITLIAVVPMAKSRLMRKRKIKVIAVSTMLSSSSGSGQFGGGASVNSMLDAICYLLHIY